MTASLLEYYYYHYFTPYEFLTQMFAGGFSLKSDESKSP